MDITGVTVKQIELPELFNEADKITIDTVVEARSQLDLQINGLDQVEQDPLEKSIRILSALRRKAEKEGYKGFSIRCWPEFFTEYGCAACGAMGMLNSEGIASGCEADVYGTISTLILNWLGGENSFIADLVDIDTRDDTGVVIGADVCEIKGVWPRHLVGTETRTKKQPPHSAGGPLSSVQQARCADTPAS